MVESNRQHTVPILIQSKEDEHGQPLHPVPLRQHSIDEKTLQRLLARYPNLIPIDEIEPAMGPLISIGQEVPTKAGPLDLLFISPDGYLSLVETKLWRNPEARRSVVGQIIDYAKEFARFSFDNLDSAVRRSQLPDDLRSKGIIDIVKSEGYEVEESLFIDTLSRNLDRGQFLLIIAGDGIRRDVASMASYLQNTPSLFFSLALLELALFRFKRDQDWPLLVQPRIVARTQEIVRAIVEVKAKREEQVEVNLPVEERSPNGQKRRVLSEQTFYDELESFTDKKTSKEVAELINDLMDLGLAPTWRASSVSIRLPDPGDSGKDFTFIIIQTDGNFWFGYLSQIALANYDASIWHEYLEAVVAMTGASYRKKKSGTLPQSVHTLLPKKEAFLKEVKICIERIQAQAEDNY